MAIFRKVHVSFWSDSYVETLTPEQKFFYLYLLTNEKTTQCGIYEISIRKMTIDTGYNTETVEKLLNFFELAGKLRYSNKTGELAMKNWTKYNDSTSPKVKACIKNELKKVKDTLLIQYLYSMDTHPQEEEEKEQEEEKEKYIEGQKFSIERCKEIALKDDKWVRLNKTNETELNRFNEYLQKQSIYELNPAEYKRYFHHLKEKKPDKVKQKLTIEDYRRMALEEDQKLKQSV